MNKKKLKPCPFCGSTDLYQYIIPKDGKRRYHIICQKCRATSGGANTEEKADKAWNERQESRWIPCSERMPEEYTNVTVSFAHGTVTELIYSKNGIFKGMYGDYTTKIITAWMPLPEPYKEKEE